MRLPRDWSGEDLIARLQRVGYLPTRQSGSHVRLTRKDEHGEHHITVPRHAAMRIGTLNRILKNVASHLGISKEELLRKIG